MICYLFIGLIIIYLLYPINSQSFITSHVAPYHSKGFGRPPFRGLILIGNRCRGDWGMKGVGGEKRREGRDTKRKETDSATDRER